MLISGERGAHRIDHHVVKLGALHFMPHNLVQVLEHGGAKFVKALGFQMGIGQLFICAQLFLIRTVGIGDLEIVGNIHGDVHGTSGNQTVDAPSPQGFNGPREVVVQTGHGNIGAGIGKVNGPERSILENRLARIKVPAEKGVDHLGDNARLAALFGIEKIVINDVASVHGLGRVVAEAADLRANAQRAHKNLVVVQPGLQMHERLAGFIVGMPQIVLIIDAAHAAPATAVKRLHVERIAYMVGNIGQVEQVVVFGRRHPVLFRIWPGFGGNEPGLGNVEPQPNHGAIGRMLLHALESKRVVEQIDAVDQRRLFEPFTRVKMPIGQPVNDQVIACGRRERKGMNADALHINIKALVIVVNNGKAPR